MTLTLWHGHVYPLLLFCVLLFGCIFSCFLLCFFLPLLFLFLFSFFFVCFFHIFIVFCHFVLFCHFFEFFFVLSQGPLLLFLVRTSWQTSQLSKRSHSHARQSEVATGRCMLRGSPLSLTPPPLSYSPLFSSPSLPSSSSSPLSSVSPTFCPLLCSILTSFLGNFPRPGVHPDVLHTYMSLAGMSLGGQPGIEPIDPALGFSKRAVALIEQQRQHQM